MATHARDWLRRCPECGDEIPALVKICPFCYYSRKEYGHYDHDSSPYLMMLDLRSEYQSLTELSDIALANGVWRSIRGVAIDPYHKQVCAVELTYEVIRGAILLRFKDYQSVLDSLETFDDLMEQELNARRDRVTKIRQITRVVVGVTLMVIATLATFILI